MILDITQEGNTLWISYFNDLGKVKINKYKLEKSDLYNWQSCSSNDPNADPIMKNWNGSSVKKVKSNFLNKYRIIEYIENLPAEEKNELFEYNFPEIFFVDIEVEVTDVFPEPEKAENKITTICIVTPNQQAIVLATKELTKNEQSKIQLEIDKHFKDINYEFSFIYKYFKSEYDMLYTYMNVFVKNSSLITGWNFIKFDWRYIVNRCKKLGIDPSICSPSNRLFSNNELPSHVAILDYLDVYAKWDRTVDIKVDYKLDTVGDAVVNIKKVKYQGTIQDMYERDYLKYVFYNVIDTALVYLIHEKIKTMDIALTMAHLSKITISKAASPVAITESLLCREFLSKNMVMATNDKSNSKRQQYEGAFVKDPVVGMHKSVAAFDFASLYPSIMRQLNISPETFIKKVDPKDINSEKSKDTIVAVTGAVYKKGDSILKNILSRLYKQRREYKSKYFEYQQLAYEIEKQKK